MLSQRGAFRLFAFVQKALLQQPSGAAAAAYPMAFGVAGAEEFTGRELRDMMENGKSVCIGFHQIWGQRKKFLHCFLDFSVQK
jgi:hypothetical protein